jgi:putative tryptophan/tyrosine transport system substrate-binding protein
VTNVVPIVMASSYDPVGVGIITNLARPGGNFTGLINNPDPDIEGKRLQLLKEALPEATRVAFLGVGDWDGPEGTSVKAAARLLRVTLIHADHAPTHYADAFALITRDRPHALFVARSNANYGNRLMIAEFAVKHRMPGIFPYREIVEAGGLMSYGTSAVYLYRHAAGHVDKILKGANPGDLPVEQPTKIEFVINLKTAAAFGLTIPSTLLASADEVIE